MEMKIMYDDAEAEMSSSAHVQRRHEKKGRLICDVKLAKKAWIAPGQHIDYTFEIEMQAMGGKKLPFIMRATGFPVAFLHIAIYDTVPNKWDGGGDKREHDEDHDDNGQTLGVGSSHSSHRHHHGQIEPESYRTEEEETSHVDRPYHEASGDRREEAAKTGDALRQVQQMAQVMYGNDDTTYGLLKQQIKLLSSYSLKALWFAMTMFYASLTHHYSTSTTFSVEDTLFLVAIIVDAALILLLSKWGNALVCISWFLLELATCLLILSFNKHYAFAILAALLLAVVVALLQPKLQHAADRHVLPFFTQDMIGDDEESPHLGHLLDLSQGIASFGGLFMAIAGRFMVGPVNAFGFFFFCAIALRLYLSMVVTVGAVTRPHAKCLAIVVMVLVVLTFIAACIPLVGHLGSKPQVVT
ncbi:unnamed protein product [Miscanthus lutarioriparius]|uniref:Uncharacterized protein n=1 Tax=Miscanthus lutarioriparius TaxID=422564 RepID=A0A811QRQ6_9POAL|nr:unnamed protein product [Miscanthus lutarioriparius]